MLGSCPTLTCSRYKISCFDLLLFEVHLSDLSRLMTKPTKWHVRPAKTQISLGIRPVWSESSLSAWRKLGSLATHWAHSEGSDQIGRMPRLSWVFAGCTCRFVDFVVRRLICPFLLPLSGIKSRHDCSNVDWVVRASICQSLIQNTAISWVVMHPQTRRGWLGYPGD